MSKIGKFFGTALAYATSHRPTEEGRSVPVVACGVPDMDEDHAEAGSCLVAPAGPALSGLKVQGWDNGEDFDHIEDGWRRDVAERSGEVYP